MKSITITLSNVETGQDEEKARRKTLEALDTLIDELCKPPVDKEAALKAFFDAGQGLVNLIRAAGKETLVGEDVGLYAEEFIRQQNESYIARCLL
ncbi:hypothetical protein ACFPES_03005 [Paenibacillus sp. GCM10023248]|uniref:hypothetical protein n=1 Tax=unclassified Paenibacillus TaxID=185978 RepID=UPI002378D33A|nr:hypothetical protein [Paenibacillus sp. MAHUQ-63]MDD9265994.1 hypothetical protein [Paenibacillus sp. MAHUQ-63]